MSKNQIRLLGALILSVFMLSGLSEAAQAQVKNGSSSCDLQLKLGSADEATCDFKEVTVNGKKVRGRVFVKKAKRVVQPEQRWGETPAADAAGVEEEFADIEIQTETECTTGCENGVRQGNPVYGSLSVRQARELNQFVLDTYKKAAMELVADGETVDERDDQVKQCLIDVNGKAIAENRRLSCRMQMFSTLSDEEREDYYENYIKTDVQAALTSSNSATRNTALQMLEKLARNLGPSEYLKESVSNLHRFGKDQQLIDTLNTLPANDFRRYGLTQYLAGEQRYFASRGMQLNTQYSSVFTDVQMESLTQDFIKYQESLTQITNQHQQAIGRSNPAPSTPGGNSMGRGSYGGFNGGPAPRAGGAPAPAWPSRQQAPSTAGRPAMGRQPLPPPPPPQGFGGPGFR